MIWHKWFVKLSLNIWVRKKNKKKNKDVTLLISYGSAANPHPTVNESPECKYLTVVALLLLPLLQLCENMLAIQREEHEDPVMPC